MFCSRRYLPKTVRSIPKILGSTCSLSTSSSGHPSPNPPLDLDPSLRALLKDVDISLVNHKHQLHQGDVHRELEILRTEPSVTVERDAHDEHDYEERSVERKSPAARFGSDRIGMVVLPLELQKSIDSLIAESDKHRLRSDAKRLFLDPEKDGSSESQWETKYDVKYRSRLQASRHSERDGTAFASVVLPAHFSAIYSVLDHVKRRLGPEWNVNKVIDWGAGTGSALWASLYAFQNPSRMAIVNTTNEPEIVRSSIVEYLGLDKRDGLVSIGKQLLRKVNSGPASVRFQKSFRDEDRIKRTNGHNALAISAFMLSSLPTPLARKSLVKEMWESGAHVIILIDHNTTAGFESIAAARDYLLNVGRKESEDLAAKDWPIKGSHVVAPCPHDSACPLSHPGSAKLVCGFSQRLQRPAFVRLTKHSGVGHEDIGYSYVVVRRGSRPSAGGIKVGRVGEVGRWALTKEALQQAPVKELCLDADHNETRTLGMKSPPVVASLESIIPDQTAVTQPEPREALEYALRLEAYNWPRLVFPPLKRSGHVILDGCTAEGKIMRMTIPKSQGKQAYYDARKSDWGDIFPHEPKNTPQERHQPTRTKRDGGTTPTKGDDIGKRGKLKKTGSASYEALSDDLKSKRKQQRRERSLLEGSLE